MSSDQTKLTKKDLERAEEVGFERGLEKGRTEVLNFLESAYINDKGRPDRGSPKGDAILELAKGLSKHVQSLRKGKK